ncbi:unnamed protein product [Trifolium pratense]|uniref:Uncharacterized protein n=1 Tax=Trifolium pratense TaxID=57577 RepID=A0ACB0L9A5_TRIPR|nr:unnamed protein product [Trifolium pratense]
MHDTLARITVVGHVRNKCGCVVIFLEGGQISLDHKISASQKGTIELWLDNGVSVHLILIINSFNPIHYMFNAITLEVGVNVYGSKIIISVFQTF